MKRTIVRIVIVIIALNVLMTILRLVLRRRFPSIGDENSDELQLAAVFDGIDLRSQATSFRGGSARTIFGGLRLDMRDALLDPAGGTFRLSAIFGGLQVLLPDDWPVRVSKARAIMGGYDHPFEDAAAAGEPALEIEIDAVFGGVEVRTGLAGMAETFWGERGPV